MIPATPSNLHDCSYMSLEDNENASVPITDSPDKKRAAAHTKSIRGNAKRMRVASSVKKMASDLKARLVNASPVKLMPTRALDDELRAEASRQAHADFDAIERAFASTTPRVSGDFFAYRDELARFADRCPEAALQAQARAQAAGADKAGQQLEAQSRAEAHKQRGNELYAAGQYARAECEYDAAARLDQRSAVLAANRAAALLMLQRYDDALVECRRAVALDASYARAHLRGAKAALCLGDVAAAQAFLAGVPAQCPRAEVDGIARQVSALASLFARADGALATEDVAAAEQAAMQAQQLAPACRRPVLVLHCARMLAFAGGSSELSARALQDAVAAVRGCGAADLYRYALLLFRRALRSEAAALLQLCVAKAPGDARAAEALRTMREMDARLHEAARLQADGRLDEAARALGCALALDPANDALNARLLFQRAGVFLQAGNPAPCERDCRACLAMLPGYDKARLRLARALVAQGEWQRAEAELAGVRTGEERFAPEVRQIRALIDGLKRARRRSGGRRGAPDGWYAVLGVAPTATQQEVRRAYKKGALRLHPDKNKHAGAEEDFKRLAEAFAVIGSPSKRRAYDAARAL